MVVRSFRFGRKSICAVDIILRKEFITICMEYFHYPLRVESTSRNMNWPYGLGITVFAYLHPSIPQCCISRCVRDMFHWIWCDIADLHEFGVCLSLCTLYTTKSIISNNPIMNCTPTLKCKRYSAFGKCSNYLKTKPIKKNSNYYNISNENK